MKELHLALKSATTVFGVGLVGLIFFSQRSAINDLYNAQDVDFLGLWVIVVLLSSVLLNLISDSVGLVLGILGISLLFNLTFPHEVIRTEILPLMRWFIGLYLGALAAQAFVKVRMYNAID